MDKTYKYRKENGLCVCCGEIAQKGKTRCMRCLQIAAAKQKDYEARKMAENPNYYAERYQYQKKWLKENPDKQKKYKERKHIYNAKYFMWGDYAET